jgi:propanol-preferring alcohol dehydrogenase
LTVADQRYCFAIPAAFGDVEAAPLLCAGLIGYRTLRLAGESERIGIYGFGAAAQIVAQVARYQGRQVFAFTRPGDKAAQDFARSLGAVWAGGSDEMPPEPLDAALIFAPVGALVPAALAATQEGRHGRVRRHPYERHPVLPLPAFMGGAGRALGRQSDPARCGGISRVGA